LRPPGRRKRPDGKLGFTCAATTASVKRLTRREAEASLDSAVATVLGRSGCRTQPTMPLLEAGERWLKQMARPDSGLSPRTIADSSWTWQKYVDSTTSSLRGLTLQQANDPPRLRGFLQRVAEAHGSASAKKAKSVLHGVIVREALTFIISATPSASGSPNEPTLTRVSGRCGRLSVLTRR
jgi:hypothetical protein